MTRAQYNAMSKDDIAKMRSQRDRDRITRINRDLDAKKMAYKVSDSDGNIFVYAGCENGFPVYRGIGGRTHMFGMNGLTVIQQYA
jgi:hypothetical protein